MPTEQRAATLALVDLHPHQRGGHFGTLLKWYASEFSERFAHVAVVTPKPRDTRKLFGRRRARPANVSFHALPAPVSQSFDLSALDAQCAFVMWSYDLLELRPLAASGVPWAGLGGMSWFVRGHDDGAAGLERDLADLFSETGDCVGAFQPDGYIDPPVEKAMWVPDVRDLRLPGRTGGAAATIRRRRSAELTVGVFGNLYGRRCVNELLRLAQVQPDVQFVLAGKVMPETVDEELRPLLGDRPLPNLLIAPGYIDGEDNLNAAIDSVDAVFIDGANYPVQSGIVCKGLHFGKWILTSPGDSWTRDLIADRQVGLAYASRDADLIGSWRAWQQSGGPQRAHQTADDLGDPAKVAAAFDAIADRLVRSARTAPARG